jgi:hypothetical protein
MKTKKLTYRQLGEKYLTSEQNGKYLKNIRVFMLDNECNNDDEKTFLETALCWSDTEEGYNYWNQIHLTIMS